MMPGPSYAPDKQLAQMAQGGLPSAVNEMQMREAMRRGARAVPQPGVPAGPPQGKMTGQQMIDDFVRRTRERNAQAAQSIVPAGTPMPQQQQTPQTPAAPPQSGGIAAFARGGVHMSGIRGFREGGSYKSQPPPNAQGRWDNGYVVGPTKPAAPAPVPMVTYDPNGYAVRGEPRTAIPKGPLYPPKEPVDPFGQTPAPRDWTMVPTPDDAFNWQRDYPMGGSEKKSEEAGFGFDEYDALKIAGVEIADFERVSAPDIKYEDPIAAGDKYAESKRGEIDKRAKPFRDATEYYKGQEEKAERNKIFDALIQGGVAMMQSGAASFDPRSGDMMGALGDGAQKYADSLLRSQDRIDELRGKILDAGAAEMEMIARSEDQMYNRGADGAKSANARNMVQGQLEYAANAANAGNSLQHAIAQAGVDVNVLTGNQRVEIAKLDAMAEMAVAKAKTSGAGNEFALDMLKDAYGAAWAARLRALGDVSPTDPSYGELSKQAMGEFIGTVAPALAQATGGSLEEAAQSLQEQYKYLSVNDKDMSDVGGPASSTSFPATPNRTGAGRTPISQLMRK